MRLPPTDHRPWPVPASPWVMTQTWRKLLFAHWSVPYDALRPLIPAQLTLDTHDQKAWIGVVPFQMAWVRPRFLPAVPWLSFFPELNVRTYVTYQGKPGIWFFSLEATQPIAIALARRFFHLPYMNARMKCEGQGQQVFYTSQRTRKGEPPATFRATYQPAGDVYFSTPGSLDEFLTERYCLYSVDPQGKLYRGEIHHIRWPLRPATATIHENTMTSGLGVSLPDEKPLLHYVEEMPMVNWLIVPVE